MTTSTHELVTNRTSTLVFGATEKLSLSDVATLQRLAEMLAGVKTWPAVSSAVGDSSSFGEPGSYGSGSPQFEVRRGV